MDASDQAPPADLVNPSAAGRLIGVRRARIMRWVRQGKLRHWLLASERYLVSAAEVRALLRPGEARPRDEPRAENREPPRLTTRRRVAEAARRRRTEEVLRANGLPVPDW